MISSVPGTMLRTNAWGLLRRPPGWFSVKSSLICYHTYQGQRWSLPWGFSMARGENLTHIEAAASPWLSRTVTQFWTVSEAPGKWASQPLRTQLGKLGNHDLDGRASVHSVKGCALYLLQALGRKVNALFTCLINDQEWNCAKKGLDPKSSMGWAIWYGWSAWSLSLRNPGSEEERERCPKGGYTPRSKTKR